MIVWHSFDLWAWIIATYAQSSDLDGSRWQKFIHAYCQAIQNMLKSLALKVLILLYMKRNTKCENPSQPMPSEQGSSMCIVHISPPSSRKVSLPRSVGRRILMATRYCVNCKLLTDLRNMHFAKVLPFISECFDMQELIFLRVASIILYSIECGNHKLPQNNLLLVSCPVPRQSL